MRSPESRFDSDSPSGPTRAVVDLSAIAANYRYLRERAVAAEVFPVVKADAYGHGAVPTARRLEEEGAARFAVATAEEGRKLRRGGVRGEILILGFSDPSDVPLHRAYGLTPTLYDLEQARAFAETTQSLSTGLPVHLKIDTGMGRLGVLPEELPKAVDLLRTAKGLRLSGTFTQLARADEAEPAPTEKQLDVMKRCLALLRGSGIDPGIVHVANSAALLLHPDSIFQAVRPGLSLYGIAPCAFLEAGGLAPAMTLVTEVMSVKKVPAGTRLGYGGHYMTRRASTIATLPIGYDGGVARCFSGCLSVLLKGERAPIVGAVSMDLTLVDATDSGARAGDRVVLLGRDGEHEVTAWDLARAADTIPYEVICSIGSRVPRVYV